MPFYIKNLNIHRFWYLWEGSCNQFLANTEGQLYVCVCVYVCVYKQYRIFYNLQFMGKKDIHKLSQKFLM